MAVKCFMLTPMDKKAVYHKLSHPSSGYTCADGYHSALSFAYILDEPWEDSRCVGKPLANCDPVNTATLLPGWPTKCPYCDYAFVPGDKYSLFTERLWQDEHGAMYVLRPTQPEFLGPPGLLFLAPPGAMWDAYWFHEYKSWQGPDGKSLHVVCPGLHEWFIDGRCSNCTMKDDDVHKCWVRHGEPPNLTVDKDGFTCSAGGGSIQTPNWHGFLRGGMLVE